MYLGHLRTLRSLSFPRRLLLRARWSTSMIIFLLLSGSTVSPSPLNFLLYGPGYGYSNWWALKKGHRGNLATRECQWKTMHACSHRRIWFLLLTEMWVTQMTKWRMNQYRKCSLAKPCVWPRETAINKAPLCDSSSLSSAPPPNPTLSLSLH